MTMSLTFLTILSADTTCCSPSIELFIVCSKTTVLVLFPELATGEPEPLAMMRFTFRPLIVRASVKVTSERDIELF